MPRKSKSKKFSKKRKASKTHNLISSGDKDLSETNAIEQMSGEGAVASIQDENLDLKTSFSDKSKSETFVSYGSSFGLTKPASSPTVNLETTILKSIRSLVKSLSIESPGKSVSIESPGKSVSIESPGKSVSLELPGKSVYIESPVRSVYIESPVRSKSFSSYERPESSASYERPESFVSNERTESAASLVRSEKIESVKLLVRSKFVELPVRSKSVEPPLRETVSEPLLRSESIKSFVTLEQNKLLDGSQSVESPVRSKWVKPPLRKVSSEPILKSELKQEALGILFTQLMIRRRPYFINLYKEANSILEYMELTGAIRKDYLGNKKRVNSRWKQNDASDWFVLLRLWDSVQRDIKIFIWALGYMYVNFEEDAIMEITTDDFYGFIEELENISNSINDLLKICKNCYYKFSRFCAFNNESAFLKNVSDYRRTFSYFRKKLKGVADKFIAFRDFIKLQIST